MFSVLLQYLCNEIRFSGILATKQIKKYGVAGRAWPAYN